MKLDIDSECCRNLVNGDVDLDRQNPCWSDTSGFLTNVRGNSVMEGQYFFLSECMGIAAVSRDVMRRQRN